MTGKIQDKRKNEMNTIATGVTGAVIGVGIAVAGAAAVVLQDKKSRDKVKKVLINVKDQALGYIEDMQKQTQDKKSDVEEKLSQNVGKAKNQAGSVEKFLHNDAKEELQVKNQI
jgi:predicted translin family RNA/ssDNA-binding protein